MNQGVQKQGMTVPTTKISYTSLEHLPQLMRYFYQFLEGKPRLHYLQKRLLRWDTRLCLHVNLLSQRNFIAQFFKIVSRLGDGWFWAGATILMLIALLFESLPASKICIKVAAVLLSSFCGYALYKFLKVHTVRPRPYQVHQAIMLGERPLDIFSFPSGHTLQAILFTMTIGHQIPTMLWVLVPFTVLIALSRLVLGLHYPTDVLVGAGIGVTFAIIGNKFSDYLASL